MLPALKAANRTDIHEVEPTANGEAGDVHLVEMPRAILLLPVFVVGWVCEPFCEQPPVVLRITADRFHLLESLGPRCAADAIPFVVQAESGVDHVLCDEVGWLRHGQKILGIAGLRAAECADLARRPVLSRKPLDGVVPVLKFSPTECPIADPGSFRFVRAAKILGADNVSSLGESRVGLSRASSAQGSVALFIEHGPRPVARREVEIS